MAKKVERIGIYGGTFSPIHMGHVKAAHAFLDEMELDRLLVIPTAVPPHKSEVEGATSDQRLEMTRLSFADSEAYKSGRLAVSDCEIKREGKSYTVFTLEHFTAPKRRLYLLVGTDMFLTLSKWYLAECILRLAHIVLMRRENDPETAALINEKRAEYENCYGTTVHIIDEPAFEVSSTELREKLHLGGDVSGLIPEAVAKYIKENQLYQ